MSKIIIVGGVAGGMSAATRLRRLMEDAEIIVMEKGPYVSFANCGLPYYVSNQISDRDDLLLQTPESLRARFDLDVRVSHEVVAIDPQTKTITVKTPEGEVQETYDKLILSPGATPFVPSMDGLDLAENVYTLRNVPDLDKIMTALSNDPKTATVIGAGFIGLEMAENLKERGLDVTIIEMAPHVLPTLDAEMAKHIEIELERNGVRVITGQSAQSFKDKGKLIQLDDGTELQSDLTIMSVGVRPDTDLAASAGVELGMRGGILVDDKYETSIEDIYAVGDAIIVKHQITGEDAMIALASPANRQGRQVADIIAGQSRSNKGSIGTAIVRVFDKTAASTGLSERAAKEAFEEVEVVHTQTNDHAGYYPGATTVFLKLVFDKSTGRILGTQAVGAKGVDKRIDVLATAIKGGLTVDDLPELELAYAPPFGSAKDPVNMIGYFAQNVLEGLTEQIQWHEVKEFMANGGWILDVRSDSEVAAGKLNYHNQIHIPINDLRDRLDELDKEQEYILLCASGLRSYIGERQLKQAGYKGKNINGGFNTLKMMIPEETV
ncbi:FAD-dependent oxidoreductase [Aerococcaceae bacterium DSM 111176]|nr:FAD-dependent oxidoreductase [Aerococcaceae bacterium DSM 111176]